MYKVTIKSKQRGLTIAIINHVHHVTVNTTLNYAYLWVGEEETTNAYLGIICTDLCDVIIDKESEEEKK